MGILVNQNQIGGGGSNSSHNIGDIFYTTRTDNSLNGAVECNGSQYNFSDFDSNLQSLFDDGKLPYVSIGNFDEMVTNQGGCDSFGYGTNELTLYPVNDMNSDNSPIEYYTNILDWSETEKDYYDKLLNVKLYDKDTHEELVGYYVKYIEEAETWWVYNNGDELVSYDVHPKVNGEPITLPTGGEFQSTTYFKVPKKLGRVLVRCQKPTSDNNYTWYNVYSDGWVEQGGGFPFSSSETYQSITFPIEFRSIKYFIQKKTGTNGTGTVSWRVISFYDLTSTSANTYNPRSGQGFVGWQASGYAASSEYTKDKWDYQNVQVERPMVQLFNGATDEAVAKCTEVLSDVAGLKQATDGMIDYVVESQEPTSGNGYTWYRLYKSGWVEQGGILQKHSIPAGNGGEQTLTLPIEMADTNYTVTFGAVDGNKAYQSATISRTTTGGTVIQMNRSASATAVIQFSYIVSGMSAQGA